MNPFYTSPSRRTGWFLLRNLACLVWWRLAFSVLPGCAVAAEAASSDRILLPEAIMDRPYFLILPLQGAEGHVQGRLTQGNLPPGLSLQNVLLQGTPSQTGDFLFRIEAQDQLGQRAEAQFQLRVVLPPADPLLIPEMPLPPCRVCTPYRASLFCQGGYGPYQWRIVQGSLPEGLRLEKHFITGEVQKLLQQPEEISLQVEVKDRLQNTAKQTLLVVVEPNEEIRLRLGAWGKSKDSQAAKVLPPATVGKPYLARLPFQGGYGKLQLECSSGSLPPGLELTEAALEGTPEKVGQWDFSVTIRDQLGQQLQLPLSLQVLDPPPPSLRVISPELPPARLGEPYRAEWKAEGGYPPYTWRLEGTLPPWLHFQDGALWGTPPDKSALGEYLFSIYLQDAHGTQLDPLPVKLLVQLHPSFPPPRFLPKPLPLAVVGQPYQSALLIQGGLSPYRIQVLKGALPPSLQLLPTGHLTGTPQQEGDWEFAVQVSDSLGQESPIQVFRLLSRRSGTPGLRLSTASILSGVVGQEVQVSFGASGGLLPYRFSVSGDLPPGLELDPTEGVLHGTPTLPGTWQIRLKLQDGSPQPEEVSSTIVLKIAPAPPWVLAGGMLAGGLFSLAGTLLFWGTFLIRRKKKSGEVPPEVPPLPAPSSTPPS